MPTRYTIADRIISLESCNGLPMVELRNTQGSAKICLQGAHVTDYRLHAEHPILWLSSTARFESGKAIRGGIPICWPWFGDHPHNGALPAHGFVRNRLWQVADARIDNDTSRLLLTVQDSPDTQALWPHTFRLELLVELGESLTLTLTTHNTNDHPITISEALHSYFALSDVRHTQIRGLDNCRYRDKLAHYAEHYQNTPLIIDAETDRVYLDTATSVCLNDAGLGRQLHISKIGSGSTVVWNPWRDKAQAMGDFDARDYPAMLCVETANALENSLSIPAGESHSLRACIQSRTYTDSGSVATGTGSNT